MIPILGLLASFAGGTYLITLDIIALLRPVSYAASISYNRCTEAMLTINFVNNWLVTLMICWKLWRVGRRAIAISDRRNNRYLAIILALVESGVLYTVGLGVYVSLWYAEVVGKSCQP